MNTLKNGSRIKKSTKKFIHKPWELKDENILKLDVDYPAPIVIHEKQGQKLYLRLNKFKTKYFRGNIKFS